MSGRGDGRDYMRESRERRAREGGRSSGEYSSSSSYADTDAYTRRAPPSSSSHEYGTSYSSYMPRFPSSHERYDVPPPPRGRRPSFDYDAAAYDYDAFGSDSTDPLRDRFGRGRKPSSSYARPAAPSPPPTSRRAAYGADEDMRSSKSKGARWVTAMSIEEADENDPKLKTLPKAPFVYAGTTDPDGTVIDKPAKKADKPTRASARDGGTSSSSSARASSSRYPPSSSYSAGAYGPSGSPHATYSASYSSSYSTPYGGASYTRTFSSGGTSYGSYSGTSSSYGRGPYGPYY